MKNLIDKLTGTGKNAGKTIKNIGEKVWEYRKPIGRVVGLTLLSGALFWRCETMSDSDYLAMGLGLASMDPDLTYNQSQALALAGQFAAEDGKRQQEIRTARERAAYRPHLILGANGKSWYPEAGYTWLNPNNPNDLRVVPIGPSGNIENVWVDWNTYENEKSGMKIHTTFNTKLTKDHKLQLSAYFYTRSGIPLRDTDQNYYSEDGVVSVGKRFICSYENARGEDYVLFIPNDQLEIREKGVSSLKFRIYLIDDSQGNLVLDASDWIYFTYTK